MMMRKRDNIQTGKIDGTIYRTKLAQISDAVWLWSIYVATTQNNGGRSGFSCFQTHTFGLCRIDFCKQFKLIINKFSSLKNAARCCELEFIRGGSPDCMSS